MIIRAPDGPPSCVGDTNVPYTVLVSRIANLVMARSGVQHPATMLCGYGFYRELASQTGGFVAVSEDARLPPFEAVAFIDRDDLYMGVLEKAVVRVLLIR